MASRIFDRIQVIGKERKDITGSFQPNGASTAVTGATGRGFTVTHTAGTANYVVTFNDKFFGWDSFWCEMSGPNNGIQAQIASDPDVKVAQTMTISLYDTSTKASTNQIDLPFAANQRVHFGIRMVNTTGNW